MRLCVVGVGCGLQCWVLRCRELVFGFGLRQYIFFFISQLKVVFQYKMQKQYKNINRKKFQSFFLFCIIYKNIQKIRISREKIYDREFEVLRVGIVGERIGSSCYFKWQGGIFYQVFIGVRVLLGCRQSEGQLVDFLWKLMFCRVLFFF